MIPKSEPPVATDQLPVPDPGPVPREFASPVNAAEPAPSSQSSGNPTREGLSCSYNGFLRGKEFPPPNVMFPLKATTPRAPMADKSLYSVLGTEIIVDKVIAYMESTERPHSNCWPLDAKLNPGLKSNLSYSSMKNHINHRHPR